MKNVRQGRQELPDIFADHVLKKCPAGDQNVLQSIEGLPDILSGRPEIIFVSVVTTGDSKGRRPTGG